MVTLTVEKSSVPAPERGGVALRNLALRIVAAALQISATIAVLQLLPPTVAGVYFKGFVIAYGLAALLRGKYDLYVAQHFVGPLDPTRSARDLVRGLGIRILIRSAITCAILLVITADMDVMDVHLRPYLQTYLPFVLAVPFATLALYLASVLRAVNQTLSSTLVATYSINIMILAVAYSASGSADDLLLLLSWAFFAGAVLAAGVGVLITRHVFPPAAQLSPIVWPEVYAASARNGLTGIALACLQWGPSCLLALMGSEIQIAHYAVITRTAQVVDYLIPAAILVPHSMLLHSKLSDVMHSEHGKLIVDLVVSLTTTTICVAAIAIATPWIVDLYGIDYTRLTEPRLVEIFVLLFAAQWLNGVGRPAIRHLAAHWKLTLIRRILFVSMLVAIASSLVGIPAYGALGAAISVCLGALLLNGQALQAAFAGCRLREHPK